MENPNFIFVKYNGKITLKNNKGIYRNNYYSTFKFNENGSIIEYIEIFKDRKDLKILPFIKGATYSHFVALVKNKKHWVDEFYKRGMQLGILIEYCIPYMPAYKKYKKSEYPGSRTTTCSKQPSRLHCFFS